MTHRSDLPLEIPVIALLLGFTAVPISLQAIQWDALGVFWSGRLDSADFVANVLGYIPLGVVLAWRGKRRALLIALAVSAGAEAIQFMSALRAPSFMDIATNIAGAGLGVFLSLRWGRKRIALPLTRPTAIAAAVLAALLTVAAPYLSPRALEHLVNITVFEPREQAEQRPPNTRGLRSPGRLEARWLFDEDTGDRIVDAEDNSLDALPMNRAAHVPGVAGAALQLNGDDQYAEIPNAPQLRLAGSMTISAWINPSHFPDGDAAIVSSEDRLERGYQFDTTSDQGVRTIGFKLASPAGASMARYGRTELHTGRWVHVAGVYDAQARTLDVYLNGRRDNGCLLGHVARSQLVSEAEPKIGRRGEYGIAHFAGAMDDVRVYSRALNAGDIAALVNQTRPTDFVDEPDLRGPLQDERCAYGVAADPTVAGFLLLFGQLVAIALFGSWPGAGRALALGLCAALGALLIPLIAVAQPLVPALFAPLLALVGGGSIVAARGDQRV